MSEVRDVHYEGRRAKQVRVMYHRNFVYALVGGGRQLLDVVLPGDYLRITRRLSQLEQAVILERALHKLRNVEGE